MLWVQSHKNGDATKTLSMTVLMTKISIMSGLRDGHLVSNLNLKEELTTYIAILLDYN